MAKTNTLGLTVKDYRGGPSTLCKGCGHDVITNTIISAYYEMGIEPSSVAKLSGIGCSSKTPTYFLNQAWGFNSVHGRMPSVATGALVANRDLQGIGVSGDGDTASIGMGQFVHMMRRNIPCIYIVENNGVYGLTKGQFSATADEGSTLKDGTINDLPPVDLCAMAIQLGCGFVARSFSADRKQLLQLLKMAIAHKGTAFLDVMSPCVTFNNHAGSTRSYDWGRDHEGPIHELGFVPHWEAPSPEFKDGEAIEVDMPDGGHIFVKRLEDAMHDPRDKAAALEVCAKDHADSKQFLTGLLYYNPELKSAVDVMELPDEPLHSLPIEKLRLSREQLAEVNEGFA